MPKPYPKQFRDDVVAVARRGEVPLAQIARDFGISEATVYNWVNRAEVEAVDVLARPSLSVARFVS